MKDEGFEYLLSILPPGPGKSCALHLLPRALDFVRARGGEFGTAQMQKRHTASGRFQKACVCYRKNPCR